MSHFYSFLLKNAIMPIADKIMHNHIIKYYNMIKKMEFWTKDEIRQWQNQKIKNLVLHAYNNTKYYRDLFDENNISPTSIKDICDLENLPILTKNDIRRNFEKLIPSNINNHDFYNKSTGGSSGNPLNYYLDKKSWSFTNANYIYNWEKTSYNYGDRYIALGSTSLFVNEKISLKHKIFYKLKGKIGLNGINMSDSVCQEYLEFINDKNINYLYGYASAIYLLAKYALDNNIKVNIKACFPTSEILTDLYRDTISKAFKCTIINGYGARDGGITAFEHDRGFFRVGYSTIVTLDKSNSSSASGAALLTDLFNYSMPLINYKLGDQLEVDNQKNQNYNKYNGQIINKVHGRTSDLMILKNGNILTGPGFTILFKNLPVKAYRIKQLDKKTIQCEISRDDDYNKDDENTILSSLRKQAGSGIELNIQYIDKFEMKSSGKRDYFITK